MSIRRNKARDLRKKGLSIKQIAMQVGAAQSSVSIWVRDIQLSPAQQITLMNNMHSKESIEKRRQSRLLHEKAKRDRVVNAAAREIIEISERELKLIATALYWAEGSKGFGATKFSNGDPEMIKLMMTFFTSVVGINRRDIRLHIHIHEHLDTKASEKYWLQITGLTHKQLHKTYNKPNKSSKNTRNTLPYGVCDLYICKSANLLLQIKGWTKGIHQSVNK